MPNARISRVCPDCAARLLRRNARCCALLVLLIISCVVSTTQAQEATSLHAAGAGERRWVVQAIRDGDATVNWLHFKKSDGDKWMPLARISGSVRDAAALDSELAIVLGSGDWRIYWAADWRYGATLPDRGQMLAIAAAGERTLAIIRRGNPPTTTTAPATAPTTTPSVEEGTAATQPADGDRPKTALFELAAGQWTQLAALPDNLEPAPTADLSLALANTQPVLALRDGGRLRVWVLLEGAWSELTVPQGDNTHFRALDGPRPRLWTAGETGAGQVTIFEADGPRSIKLDTPGDALTTPARTVETFGDVLHLIYTRDSQLILQAYDDDGKLTGEPTTLAAPQPPADPRVGQWIEVALIAAMVFVLISTIRHRQLEPPSVQGLQGLQLARFSLRFFAGMVDLWPQWAASVVGVYWTYTGDTTLDAVLLQGRTQLLLVGAMVAYVLHTLILELLTQRSIGKMIFGLRVTDFSGAKPARSAIVIRNVLRVLDISFLFFLPLLLVRFTPLRQRLGDLAARTIVVEKQLAEPPQESSIDTQA
jgi:uncharacterized RDD family membrane protein YckC